jgi:superfamily II DNA or RNA helicase
LIEIPTAGGKSFILANFIWNVLKNVDRNFKSLILVPNVQLVQQFWKDLIDYGFDKRDLAKFTGGMSKQEMLKNNITEAKITIANR